jgi:hypothetical protein
MHAVRPESGMQNVVELPFRIEQLIRNNRGDSWSENNFVYYDSEANVQGEYVLTSANQTAIARQAFADVQSFQNWVENSQDEIVYLESDLYCPNVVNQVISYHVNVGHGNCTFIAIKRTTEPRCEFWMVDCSLSEVHYKNSSATNFKANLEAAFDDVANEFHIERDEIRLSRFILTHKHYDHYSGMEYLISSNRIDSKTVIFLNYYFVNASPTFLRIQNLIRSKNIRVVEPTISTKVPAMKFLYPECRIINNTNKCRPGCRVENITNETSIVTCIDIAGHKMILPGDLGQKGFALMIGVNNCSSDLATCEFYCASHHGSLNGHPTNIYTENHIPVLHRLSNMLKHAVIMGRDGAYRGIYDKTNVIPYWNKQLLFSERDSQGNSHPFLKLNW